MSGKILVTGVNGFVGHHVAKKLHEKGVEVLGVGNQPELQSDLVNIVDEYLSVDLTNPDAVSEIDMERVSAIINLAGFAKVGDSKGQGELYNKVNVGVHTVLYEECLSQGVSPRIIAVSTGAVYDPSQSLPITEDSSLIPENKTNEYVISKQLMERAVSGYTDKGLEVIVVRPFNHSGPGQLPGFLLPDLGEQINEAAKKSTPLMVGNLKTKRDYTDVRDVAEAYVELATAPSGSLNHNIYNVCSGKSTPGDEILQKLITEFGATNLDVIVDPARLRKNDVADIYGSADRLKKDAGWEPKFSVSEMISDYVSWKKQK